MVQIDTDVMRIARESIGRTSPVETYATTDERNLKTSVGASAAAGYLAAMTTLGIYAAKAAGYDMGPIDNAEELLGPGGNAAIAAMMTFPLFRR